MLLQLRIQNFLSYRDEVVFNMIASDEEYKNHHVSDLNGIKVLRSAALYGANASGKSNFIKAVHFAKNQVVRSNEGGKISFQPFKLIKESSDSPSRFQFTIYKNNIVYEYGFALNRDRILEEWLFRLNGELEEVMFTRETDEDSQTVIQIHDALAPQDSDERRVMDVLASTTRARQRKQLFLAKLYENDIEQVTPVVQWFQDLQIVYPDTKYDFLELKSLNDEEFRDFLSDVLKRLDTGIDKVELVEQEFELNELFSHVPLEVKEKLQEIVHEIEEDSFRVFELSDRRYLVNRTNGATKLLKLVAKRKLSTGEEIDFELYEESDGTQRLFDMIPMMFDLYHNERVYLVDELDRSLHTLLSESLLRLFLDRYPNQHKSQFIFTTHDTDLMNLLRDDEIWLISKKSHYASVGSVLDYDIDASLFKKKGYLNGRFEGVPIIQPLQPPRKGGDENVS